MQQCLLHEVANFVRGVCVCDPRRHRRHRGNLEHRRLLDVFEGAHKGRSALGPSLCQVPRDVQQRARPRAHRRDHQQALRHEDSHGAEQAAAHVHRQGAHGPRAGPRCQAGHSFPGPHPNRGAVRSHEHARDGHKQGSCRRVCPGDEHGLRRDEDPPRETRLPHRQAWHGEERAAAHLGRCPASANGSRWRLLHPVPLARAPCTRRRHVHQGIAL
mmetsp:Transcript_23706/g.68159  ORF Transcript_23706/g.68159 Transcript_23706/m.68159 type:complete len:215 (-) Transcript_23706:618-1262(-)